MAKINLFIPLQPKITYLVLIIYKPKCVLMCGISLCEMNIKRLELAVQYWLIAHITVKLMTFVCNITPVMVISLMEF